MSIREYAFDKRIITNAVSIFALKISIRRAIHFLELLYSGGKCHLKIYRDSCSDSSFLQCLCCHSSSVVTNMKGNNARDPHLKAQHITVGHHEKIYWLKILRFTKKLFRNSISPFHLLNASSVVTGLFSKL